MRRHVFRKLTRRFDEKVKFFRTWIGEPKIIGAIWPTSLFTAHKIAGLIDLPKGGLVLELGPGTGVITRAILQRGIPAKDIYSVEYTASFIPKLKMSYPGVNFIQGNAFKLEEALPDNIEPFCAVVSTLPLLNYPVEQRLAFIRQVFERMLPGRPVIQLCYGLASPIPPKCSTYTVEPLGWTMRNLPPARLWGYRYVKDQPGSLPP